ASIGIWVVLTIVGIIIWLPQLLSARRKKKATAKETLVDSKPIIKVNLLKSRLAWAVTIYMGLQSLMYYCFTAWLPKVAQDWGMSIEASGWVLAYVQFAQLPTTFVGSILAARMRDQRFLSALTGVLFILGITGILIFKTKYILLWCILLGVASGLAFSLSMLFFVLRTQNTLQAAKLSGMAQSFGYLIAATGPAIFGGIFDLTSSWTLSFVFLMLMSVVLLVAGVIAGKDSWVS
ncbi:MAG TPA: MFS transporter, partial [Flavobacteriaceae bacterium]|nr:MFS transporter [Flavobacteriaceae bacterium]